MPAPSTRASGIAGRSRFVYLGFQVQTTSGNPKLNVRHFRSHSIGSNKPACRRSTPVKFMPRRLELLVRINQRLKCKRHISPRERLVAPRAGQMISNSVIGAVH